MTKNEETRDAWNENAAFWDERMGEGNDFVEVLTWSPTERLLAMQPGERVLDIACGNGLTSRRLADLGARVVAFDFAAEMIAHARRRTSQTSEPIEYFVLGAGFAAGFVLDALEERAFPADHPPGRNPLHWGANFSEIPPVLVARLRLPGHYPC